MSPVEDHSRSHPIPSGAVLNSSSASVGSLSPTVPSRTRGDAPVLGSGNLFISDTGDQTTEPSWGLYEPGFVEMISQIRARLGLNMSQLAEVLRVGRPTIYAWLREEQVPHASNRARVRDVWKLAQAWGEITPQPLGADYERLVTRDGYQLRELLSAEPLRTFVIREELVRLATERGERTQAPGLGERLAAKHGVGEKPYASEDQEFLTGRRSRPE